MIFKAHRPAAVTLAALLALITLAATPGCETLPIFGGPDNDPVAAKQALVDRVEQLEASKERAASVVEGINTKIDQFSDQLQDIPDDDSLKDKVRDAITTLQSQLATAQQYEQQIDESIAATRADIESIVADPDAGATGTTVGLDGIAAAARNTGAAVPGPVGTGLTIVGFALAGIADFIRRKRKKEYEEDRAAKDAELRATEAKIAEAQRDLETLVFSLDNAQKADPELKKQIQKNGATLRAANGPALDAKIRAMRIDQ